MFRISSAVIFSTFVFICNLSAQEIDNELWEKALKLHKKAFVIDAHTHPMMDIFSNRDDLDLGKDTYKSNINFIIMKKGGLDAFFFPLPLRNEPNGDKPSKKIIRSKLICCHFDRRDAKRTEVEKSIK